MKKIIFRVDDRLIHGQVIEGWIKYYKIHHVIVASDRVLNDPLLKTIYSSSLPPGCTLDICSLDELHDTFRKSAYGKDYVLILVESVGELYSIRDLIDEDVYVNIGCVASREHKIEISDTVFLDADEIKMATIIRDMAELYIRKVPWEPSVEIKNFARFLEEGM